MSEIFEGPTSEKPVRKTWRSWFTTGRIFLLSLLLVLAIVLGSCAAKEVKQKRMHAEYDAEIQRQVEVRESAAAADPINFHDAPEGFEKLVDRTLFDELTVTETSQNRVATDDAWRVTAQPSAVASEHPEGFAEQMKKLATAPGVQTLVLYSSAGSEITLDQDKVADLSPVAWKALVDAIRSDYSYVGQLSAEGVVSVKVHRGGSNSKDDTVGKTEAQDAARQVASLPVGEGIAGVSAEASYLVEQPGGDIATVKLSGVGQEQVESFIQTADLLTVYDWQENLDYVEVSYCEDASPQSYNPEKIRVDVYLDPNKDQGKVASQEKMLALQEQLQATLGQDFSFDVYVGAASDVGSSVDRHLYSNQEGSSAYSG